MIIADHDFCQENKGKDNVDKECFRTEFFQKILPKIACYSLVKKKVILPFCPWILFQMVLNKDTIKDLYVLKFTEEDIFMKASINKSTNYARKMDLYTNPYHGSDNPMTACEVMDRMQRFSSYEKRDHENIQKKYRLTKEFLGIST